MSMKNSVYTIGNRTRKLPTCSAVPQQTALPRAPNSSVQYFIHRLTTCLGLLWPLFSPIAVSSTDVTVYCSDISSEAHVNFVQMINVVVTCLNL